MSRGADTSQILIIVILTFAIDDTLLQRKRFRTPHPTHPARTYLTLVALSCGTAILAINNALLGYVINRISGMVRYKACAANCLVCKRNPNRAGAIRILVRIAEDTDDFSICVRLRIVG